MKKITLLDGASGTCLWEKSTDKIPVWQYNMLNPDIVVQLHREYIDAGSKIISANTFGANRDMVKDTPYSVAQAVSQGIYLAKEAAKGTDVKVALDVGPLSVLLEPYGDLTEEEAAEIYEEQIGAGMDAGADAITLETFLDVNMLEIAVNAAKQYSVPVYCMMTFEKVGKTMMGQSVEDILEVLEPLNISAVGLNCSLGPDLALPIIREFKEKTQLPLMFKPNAGMPEMTAEGKVVYNCTAEKFVEQILPAAEWVDYMGGCCGSTPAYISGLADALKAKGLLD